MKLSDLLKDIEYTCVSGSVETEVTAVCYDSRKEIPEGAAFICIKGAVSDGHDSAADVIEKGAGVIIAERVLDIKKDIVQIITKDTRKALACVSAAWFGYPARKLKTIGITGTKGKSTTSYMIKSILEEAGHKVGIIGTIGVCIGEQCLATNNTTPESYILHDYFRRMLEEGCDTLIMEVSSQGLKQSRVYGIEFDYGIFTNLEPDHIGGAEHADFEEYMYCKSLLFRQCKTGIVNIDDKNLEGILKDHTCSIETYGMSENAETKASDEILYMKDGIMGISYKVSGRVKGDILLTIPGHFNVYNSVAAIAVCRHFTTDEALINRALQRTNVRGRLEPVNISDKFILLIDYAHNAMALESVLKTLKEYNPGRLVCLFGCGGNRSRERRFEMGEVSARLADLTVVSSDNPRFEEPMDIINDILVGVGRGEGKYITIPDRREAIRYVIENAEENDIIILAGKGNEDYQEIKGVKYHMDEREIIAEITADWRG